ncbi:ATP-binding cassette domain-containing protein [Heliobacterium gestii]|uniref:ATP-binding cassette domain-containing protein n=1 Tax=Heliomicrobium gestii TaxID=2699 RepID=A0A845LA58_HELGE|nr:sulfate/molybdate ABC transporter ATP-binding protein [Heliomicrobium gestii]MBM7865570.1 ABC-type sulfate/molybdate transport systems ATPase subunit [Heliomicrobium gestii]MZP41820.1 ATP-binding cassette domain-containing protein [Heliomicrobium gestii]
MELSVDIEKRFPGFSLQVSFATAGEPLGLLGASGSGKTMILRSIAGIVTPDRGRITLNGRVLFDSEKGINLPSRQRRVGFLFQDYAVFPHMTVAENILFGLHYLDIPQQEQRRRLEEKIVQFQLEGLADRFPGQLSGGQQQRVALARALSVDPDALLLDEPFSALDNHLRSQMESELLKTLSDYSGATLFVTHNLDEAYRVCQSLLILSKGRVSAFGSKKGIFQAPPTITAARLTGCKNLSRARVLSSDRLEALDWGCTLHLASPPPPSSVYVGIRARHLRIADGPGGVNTFPCRLSQVIDMTEGKTVLLELTGDAPFDTSPTEGRTRLSLYMSETSWNRLTDRPFPWWVHLDPEQLFAATDDPDRPA